MSPQPRKSAKKTVELQLVYDDERQLKAGKRRYQDEKGHNLYMTGAEVRELGSPDAVLVTVTSA